MTHHVTRRAAISSIIGVAAAPVLASACTAPAFANATAYGSRWWRLHARLERLTAARMEYGREVEDPAYAAWREDVDRLPHSTTTRTYASWADGKPNTMTTACKTDVDATLVLDKLQASPNLSDYHACSVELLGLHLSRQAEIERLSQLHGVDAKVERGERMDDLIFKLTWRLLTMPAPDGAAAQWKFDYLFGPEHFGATSTTNWSLDDEDVRVAIADVRRCLNAETFQ